MKSNLKRDQLPPQQAQNWKLNVSEEEKLTFNLTVPTILLQKETYKLLLGENDNRIRIYLGLEPKKMNGKYTLCAYAVSAFLLGSGDVYIDYETPVFELGRDNKDLSSETPFVLENIKRYRKWRAGELDPENEWGAFRKYIYPNGYLLNKYELNEVFVQQNKPVAQIAFGISKTMNAMIYTNVSETMTAADNTEVYDFSNPCPPNCDETSIYNSGNASE